jgi:hypothetical protein
MKKANLSLWIGLATLLVAVACLSTLPSPASVPVAATPDLRKTGQVQTLTAALSSTATKTPIRPTETSTITLTPFPSITPLPTATATATNTPFGFVASPTPGLFTDATPTVETVDSADGVTTDWGSNYRCTLLDKAPQTGETLAAGSMYKVYWSLLNSGQKTWQADGVLVQYLDGDKLEMAKDVKLVKDVKVGQSVKLGVTFILPNAPGHYRAVWGLVQKKGDVVFCTFTVNVMAE